MGKSVFNKKDVGAVGKKPLHEKGKIIEKDAQKIKVFFDKHIEQSIQKKNATVSKDERKELFWFATLMDDKILFDEPIAGFGEALIEFENMVQTMNKPSYPSFMNMNKGKIKE